MRYEQETARMERAGNLRVFYFGLLSAMVSMLATVLHDHRLEWRDSPADFVFWLSVALSVIGCVYVFCQLLAAIRPMKFGYLPLPHTVREYADGCFEHYHALGMSEADAHVEEDIDRVVIKRLEETTFVNSHTNNQRNYSTHRAFWGLVIAGVFIVITFFCSLWSKPMQESIIQPKGQADEQARPFSFSSHDPFNAQRPIPPCATETRGTFRNLHRRGHQGDISRGRDHQPSRA